eukprot:12238-Heterococcus_DN1.PRE.1
MRTPALAATHHITAADATLSNAFVLSTFVQQGVKRGDAADVKALSAKLLYTAATAVTRMTHAATVCRLCTFRPYL